MATLPYTEIGVHIPEAITEIRAAMAAPRLSSATRLSNLAVCALAAFDDEPEPFGAAASAKFNPVFWLGVLEFAVSIFRRLRTEEAGFGESEDSDLRSQGEALIAQAEAA